jgi:hypothetical protein
MFPDHPIVQVAGNHEFYDGCYEASLNALRETAQRLQIHFLENDCVAIDGVEFIGCTLWTDYQVFELPGRPHAMSRLAAMQACRDRIADHRAIQLETGLGPAGSGRRFEPSDAARLHEASRAFLHERLARPDPARECVPPSRQLPDEASGAEACNASSQAKVVVTHHLPSWRCVDSRYAQSVTNAAFCSDLDDLIGKASLWIHGHTHVSLDRMLEGTRVVCNPRGYPRRAMPGGFENPDFDPVRVLELARSGA